MDASIVRLAPRDRVFIPIRANVDQLVPVVASLASEEATGLIDIRLGGGEHYFQPAIPTFPHGALPHTVTFILAPRPEKSL